MVLPRPILISASIGLMMMGFAGQTQAQSAKQLFDQISTHRLNSLRRHNDIQGVEAVFDDYRRRWLQRQNSGVLIGRAAHEAGADTPVCGGSYFSAKQQGSAKLCGNGHLARAHSSVFYGRDNHKGARIRETGNISYIGYEHLVSNRFFLGFGVSGGRSTINNRSGDGAKLDVTEYAGHLLGGYRINDSNMIVWNLTGIRSDNDWTQSGNVTGSYRTDGIFATGAWYKNVQLTETAYVSLGLDYTLQIAWDRSVVGHDDVLRRTRGDKGGKGRGDFTTSALFLQRYDTTELFARFGVTFTPISFVGYTEDRPVDAHIDVGWSARLSETTAITGAVGTSFRNSEDTELRGTLRIVGRY
jgi:hypothetical protein